MTIYDEVRSNVNSVNITIPVEYIEWVSIGLKGAEIFLNANTCPWDAASFTVDLGTALDAAGKIARNWAVDE